MDIVVVGDGMLGVFVADRLRAAGVGTVALVGPAGRPAAASTAAGAMLGCFGEVTKDTYSTLAAQAKFGISRAAHRFWPTVVDELQTVAREHGERLWTVDDTHVVLNGCGGLLDTENFNAIVAGLEAEGQGWSEVDPRDIPGYAPRPDGRAIRAIHLPGEGAVDGNHVLRLMDLRLNRSGVRHIQRAVAELIVSGDRIAGVRLDDGEKIAAGIVVVAAGATSAALLRTALGPGDVMPMFAGVGLALVGQRTENAAFETVVRTPNRGGACGLHLVPLSDGREYLGATNVLFRHPQVHGTVGAGRALCDTAMQQLDEAIATHRVLEWRTGNRPVTLDGFPLIGWTSVPGLYLLSGTYRDGLHAAPALAEHVTRQIVDGGSGTLETPFAPGRSPIETWPVEQAIREYALHMTALWFESGARAPREVYVSALTRQFTEEARRLYERSKIEVGLPPEVLMFMSHTRDHLGLTDVFRYLQGTSTTGPASSASRPTDTTGAGIAPAAFPDGDIVVGQRVVIGDGVELGPGVRIGDDVEVGARAEVGAGSQVMPGVRIGPEARLCDGAVVAQDVPALAVVQGNPASVVGYLPGTSSDSDASPSRYARRLRKVKEPRGALAVLEHGRELTFQPRRCLVIYDVPDGGHRGDHAHKTLHELIVCVRGSCKVVLDDGKGSREILSLEQPDFAVEVPPMVWVAQFGHTADAVTLVFSSAAFSPSDYVEDYDEFRALVSQP